jgi:hypothetical protein
VELGQMERLLGPYLLVLIIPKHLSLGFFKQRILICKFVVSKYMVYLLLHQKSKLNQQLMEHKKLSRLVQKSRRLTQREQEDSLHRTLFTEIPSLVLEKP